jgi:hypothetical protein
VDVVDGVESALIISRMEKLEMGGVSGGGARPGVVEGGVLWEVARHFTATRHPDADDRR